MVMSGVITVVTGVMEKITSGVITVTEGQQLGAALAWLHRVRSVGTGVRLRDRPSLAPPCAFCGHWGQTEGPPWPGSTVCVLWALGSD
ncbi:hypothetical protein ACOMHN_022880 [Nucella lapillus]